MQIALATVQHAAGQLHVHVALAGLAVGGVRFQVVLNGLQGLVLFGELLLRQVGRFEVDELGERTADVHAEPGVLQRQGACGRAEDVAHCVGAIGVVVKITFSVRGKEEIGLGCWTFFFESVGL